MPTSNPHLPSSSRSAREPQLLHFRLSQMLIAIAMLSVLFALLVLTPAPWPLVIIFLTLLIAAHVGGNLIGTRLRNGNQKIYKRPRPQKAKQR